MKTKMVATVMGVIAMLSIGCYPNTTVRAYEAKNETKMTWSEYKEVKFDKDYTMVQSLVERLSAIEYEADNNLERTTSRYGYGGLDAKKYAEEYPLCKDITRAFNEETGLKLCVTTNKLNSKFCQVDISYETRRPQRINKTGETATLELGTSYYESAWGFGSGKDFWVKEKGDIQGDMKVELLAVAKLDDNGNVLNVDYSKGTPIREGENVMILIGTGKTTIGWVAPNSIR
ncbi:MAG: hypothetical protein IKF38_00170 [Clostridia bacterium]|nr:hypothetical protein [Clostridia bacterium]